MYRQIATADALYRVTQVVGVALLEILLMAGSITNLVIGIKTSELLTFGEIIARFLPLTLGNVLTFAYFLWIYRYSRYGLR
jgi:hypothetical protein